MRAASPAPFASTQAGNVSSPEVLSAADALFATYNLTALNFTTNGTESAATSIFRSADSLGSPAVLLLHNTSSRHALPIFLAELDAAEARYKTGARVNITASVKALPLTAEERAALDTFLKLLASFFILVPFSYLPATYAAFSVRERAVQAKLLQLTSGCSPYAYWLAQLTWELLNHTGELLWCSLPCSLVVRSAADHCCSPPCRMLRKENPRALPRLLTRYCAACTSFPCVPGPFFPAAVVVLCMCIFAMYDMDVLVGTADKGFGCFLLLELYGLAVIPLSFVYSFAFTNHSAAQVAIALANFVTGFCLVMASYIMGATAATQALNARLVNLYRIFPAFLLGEGLIALVTADFNFSVGNANGGGGGGSAGAPAAGAPGSSGSNSSSSLFAAPGSNYTAGAAAASNGFFTDLFGKQEKRSAFEWLLLGRPLLLLVAEFALYTVLTFVIEREQRRLALWISAVRHFVNDKVADPLRRLLRLGPSAPPGSLAGGGGAGANQPSSSDPEAGTHHGEFHRVHRDLHANGEWVEDPGVAAERERVQKQQQQRGGGGAEKAGGGGEEGLGGLGEDEGEDAVAVRGIRKVFGAEGKASQKVAVDSVWLGIPAGERFGLLGSNGALARPPARRSQPAPRTSPLTTHSSPVPLL